MARKATKKTARTVKGWGKHAPKTATERRKLYARCGAKAFLVPEELKYPIMPKSGPCVVDCQGLRAAKSRLGAQGLYSIQRKVDKIGKSAACHWANKKGN